MTSQSRFADGHSGSIFDFLQNAVILKNRHGRDRLIRRRRSNRPGNSQATRLRACRRNVHRGRACRRRRIRGRCQGLRACEVCDLQWHQVELSAGRLHVRRSKRGTPSVHPLQGDEIRALRRLQRSSKAPTPYVFASERGGPMSAKSFGTLFARLGERAGMAFSVFPHMLRHACGYALANAGHDTRALQAWLGHRNIQHTARYTELAPDRLRTSGGISPAFFHPSPKGRGDLGGANRPLDAYIGRGPRAPPRASGRCLWGAERELQAHGLCSRTTRRQS